MADSQGHVESGVGLRQYLEVIRRRKWIVLAVTVLAFAAAAAFTALQAPKYEARTTIVVGQGGGIVQPQNANAIQPFSATMQELLKSSIVARTVIGSLHLALTPEQLLRKVSVSFNPESAALQVGVVDTSPARAEAIARKIGGAFSRIVALRLGKGQPAAPGVPATPGLTAVVWDPAHLVPGKVSPKPVENLVIAVVLGLVLGLLAAFVRDYLDRSLRTVEEIEEAFAVPVIGQIATIRSDREGARVFWDENGDFAESFRVLRANLQYLAVGRPLRTILVTSLAAGQGKTTVCANLSKALAHAGASVALLETDLRRPQLGNAFGVPAQSAGLTNVLVGRTSLLDAQRVVLPSLQSGGADDHYVSLLPSGPLPPNPSELLASPAMREVVGQLGSRFDFVVLDSPPILLVSDAVELAQMVDGIILVIRSDQATKDEARDLTGLVHRLGLKLVGVVLTGVRSRVSYDSYYTADADLRRLPALDYGAGAGPVRVIKGASDEAPAAREGTPRAVSE
jgi:succinoglycan biosynthesis transport protein ExoP